MTELDIVIQGLADDSRSVQQNDLFFAIAGDTVNGEQFISQAIEKGAAAVLTENFVTSQNHIPIIPIIPFMDLKENMGFIAARFFEEPSKNMSVIGITGTNGKTSCSHFIAQVLAYCGKACGVIGTLGIGSLQTLKAFDCTTPGAITLQKSLSSFRQQDINTVAMEVSSHALMQYRVSGTSFHTTVFTNLTRDHLDYHGDMEKYFDAKKKLFSEFESEFCFINVDDDYGKKLIVEDLKVKNKIGYTLNPNNTNTMTEKIISIQEVVFNDLGLQGYVKTPWGVGNLRCPLLGHFNLSNILAILGATCAEGIPFNQVLEAIAELKTVPGRMMRLGGQNKPSVVIDYAHTPDALQQILTAVRSHSEGKIWCIFGCGGDRDRGKRPIMARIAEQFSDYVIMAPDNPRTEDQKQIFAEMLQGFLDPTKVKVEPDRRKAIQFAIQMAKPGDWVVIAGKGHENYQIIQQEKIPFCDITEAKIALQENIDS